MQPSDSVLELLSQFHQTIPLVQDGSNREYLRALDQAGSIKGVLMVLKGDDHLALKDGQYDWLHVQETLQKAEIPAPKVIKIFKDAGVIWHEDLGDVTLQIFVDQARDPVKIKEMYEQCFLSLKKLQGIKATPSDIWSKRAFDQEKYLWELNFFRKKLLLPFDLLKDHEEELFQREAMDLSHTLAAHSHFFVHRDLHSRNIMIYQKTPYLIDFQDARLGHGAYDLVSLCFDAYVDLSLTTRLHLLDLGIEALSQEDQKLKTTLQEEWPLVLFQRQLKAMGSFGFLDHELKKGSYLSHIPTILLQLSSLQTELKNWPFLSQTLLKRLKERFPPHA